MRKLILPFIFIACTINATAQNFTGQWKGGFVDKSVSAYNWGSEKSDYVLDIDIKGNNVSGYSYTYFSADGKKYYTICKIKGIFFKNTKSIEIVETERTKTNIPQEITNSFQLHKLRWRKEGKDEILEGEWKPAPGQDNRSTGFGTTVLKKRQLTEISALAKNKNNPSATKKEKISPERLLTTKKETPTTTVFNKSKNQLETVAIKKKTVEKIVTKKPNLVSNNSIKKPIVPPSKKPITTISPIIINETKPKDNTGVDATVKILKPNIIGFEKRKNNIIKTIVTENESIKLELYDNGDVDGDSVTVFFNNEVLISHKRLTEQPLKLELPIKDNEPNELVMYADNLGTIPPNTALLIVTDGKKRYEVRITSDLEKSGGIKFVHSKKE